MFKPPIQPYPHPGISKQEQESKITLWSDNNVQNLLIELSLLEKKWDLGREPGRGRRRCDDRGMDRWRKEGQEEGRREDGSHGREVKQSVKGWSRRAGGGREGENQARASVTWTVHEKKRRGRKNQSFPQLCGWRDTLSPVSDSNHEQKAVLWGWFQQGHYQILKIEIKMDPQVAWRWVGGAVISPSTCLTPSSFPFKMFTLCVDLFYILFCVYFRKSIATSQYLLFPGLKSIKFWPKTAQMSRCLRV